MSGEIGGVRDDGIPYAPGRRRTRKKSKSEEKTKAVASKKRERDIDIQPSPKIAQKKEPRTRSTVKKIPKSEEKTKAVALKKREREAAIQAPKSEQLPSKPPGPKKKACLETEEKVAAEADQILAHRAPSLLDQWVFSYIRKPEEEEIITACTQLAGLVSSVALNYMLQLSPWYTVPIGFIAKKITKELVKNAYKVTTVAEQTFAQSAVRVIRNITDLKKEDAIDLCTDTAGAVYNHVLREKLGIPFVAAVPIVIKAKKVTKETLKRIL